MDRQSFYVVVPFFNEEKGIRPTLDSLAAQTDRAFSLVLVDNASTDGTCAVIRDWQARTPDLAVTIIGESQRGTGAASDTGFRYAIAAGARVIARTDADCVPAPDWVARLKACFTADGLEFVAGGIRPRRDEIPIGPADLLIMHVLIRVAAAYGRVARRGREFKYPYILVAGNNMAITADLYVRAGGFPRTTIAEEHEDKVLSERVRRITARVRLREDIVVYNSVRRAKRYGYWNTLLWYWDHKYTPAEVDVR
jgi:glycosyltransferase involved in cell wall biosynthesis